ncbi:hypothetical protein ACF0H5_023750 [Mactra antiquata]
MAVINTDNISKIIILMMSTLALVHGVALRNYDSYEWNKSADKPDVSLGGLSALRMKSSRMFPFVDTANHRHLASVDHFARHGLCNHSKGKQHFYQALKSALCEIKDSFAASMVEDLCKEKERYMLNKWIGELFDTDGDGYITHYERTQYAHDD